MLNRKLVQPNETETLSAEIGVGVEILVSRPVGKQMPIRLPRVECRTAQLAHPGRLERFGNRGVAPECRGALLEQKIHPHVRGGRVPYPDDIFSPARLVVEMPWPRITRPAISAAVLQQVDERECVGKIDV